MATEVTQEDIATAALQPAEMETDAGKVKQRPISELIAARDAAAAVDASSQGHRGIRFTKLIPGSADGT